MIQLTKTAAKFVILSFVENGRNKSSNQQYSCNNCSTYQVLNHMKKSLN